MGCPGRTEAGVGIIPDKSTEPKSIHGQIEISKGQSGGFDGDSLVASDFSHVVSARGRLKSLRLPAALQWHVRLGGPARSGAPHLQLAGEQVPRSKTAESFARPEEELHLGLSPVCVTAYGSM